MKFQQMFLYHTWFKDINIQKSKVIMKLPRNKLSVLVRFITGHCHLKRQNVLTNKLDAYDTNCRLCGMDRERAIHILTQCEPLWSHRITAFGQPFLDFDPPDWSVQKMCSFLSLDIVSRLEELLE